MGSLILIRHGQSEWNAAGRFTGWVDIALSEAGRAQSARAGRRLAAAGYRVDRAFTSTLARAVETGAIVLEALGGRRLEQERAWQLNERFYGALTGRSKAEAAAEFGAEQVHRWRRGYDVRPPGGESLEDTARRALPYFHDVILPAARRHEGVLVAAHGNSLRAVVQALEGLDGDAVAGLEIPLGVPIVYVRDGGAWRGRHVLAAAGGDAAPPAHRR